MLCVFVFYDTQKSFLIKATRLRELFEISEVKHENKHRRYFHQ